MTSELMTLLRKNADWVGLDSQEQDTALELIAKAEENDEDCWLCKMVYLPDWPDRVDKSIYDSCLCKGHAVYALATRK